MAYIFFNLLRFNLYFKCISVLVLLLIFSKIPEGIRQLFHKHFFKNWTPCYEALMGHMYYTINICFSLFIIMFIHVCIYLWVCLYLHIILKAYTCLSIYICIYLSVLTLYLCHRKKQMTTTLPSPPVLDMVTATAKTKTKTWHPKPI